MPVPDTLITDRLCIRPYLQGDLASLVRFFNNPRVTRYTDLPDGQTHEETAAFLGMILASYATQEPIFAFAVTLRDGGEVVGSCGFAPMDDESTVQIYYAFFPEYWGKGYATEAAGRMIEYIFSLGRFGTIVVDSALGNPASGRVAERLGMQPLGIVEQKGRHSRRYVLNRV
ncbi:GNAT family N-acetyltransferase [Methanoculleus sp. FWC-SCC1]|uniref:GNAT family N-acetyltransferase n=1 Tax=Methanoculleus frigidifontis TaxID=2584085 RepID=A0ABT8M9F9_9EURY|nr:GNAT family N-acetyltransferase [Methanoculleus sp. FWC-SCC1]MDN7024576.1 GNAT family N-acetyltransferase [Methanoculleus sp. FWC-SCC1]